VHATVTSPLPHLQGLSFQDDAPGARGNDELSSPFTTSFLFQEFDHSIDATFLRHFLTQLGQGG